MNYVLRLSYLFGKYLVITNFLDLGYSRSRDPHDHKKNWLMLGHVAAQVAVTAFLLRYNELGVLVTMLAIEASLLILCTLLERHAKVAQALKAYLAVEFIMLAGYGLMVYLSN